VKEDNMDALWWIAVLSPLGLIPLVLLMRWSER